MIYRVEAAANKLGVSPSFLRHNDGKRLPAASRDINRWRVYTDEDLEHLRTLLAPRPAAQETRG